HYAVGTRALEAALRHDPSATPTAARGKALDGLASLAYLTGDYDGAEGAFRASLELHRRIDSPQGIARAHTGLGHVASQRNDYDAARTHHGESLAASRAIQDTQGIAA